MNTGVEKGLSSTYPNLSLSRRRVVNRLYRAAAAAGDVVKLVKRHLRRFSCVLIEKEAGRIVYSTADAELEMRCVARCEQRVAEGRWAEALHRCG